MKHNLKCFPKEYETVKPDSEYYEDLWKRALVWKEELEIELRQLKEAAERNVQELEGKTNDFSNYLIEKTIRDTINEILGEKEVAGAS